MKLPTNVVHTLSSTPILVEAIHLLKALLPDV
jgi:hypothetical protein